MIPLCHSKTIVKWQLFCAYLCACGPGQENDSKLYAVELKDIIKHGDSIGTGTREGILREQPKTFFVICRPSINGTKGCQEREIEEAKVCM